MKIKELIKEAEYLYNQISKLQTKLIPSISNNDNELLIKNKSLLKNITEHGNNIVNLEEIWHSNKSIPQGNRKIIAVDIYGSLLCGTFIVKGGMYRANISSNIVETSFWDNIAKWAYIDKLLPK